MFRIKLELGISFRIRFTDHEVHSIWFYPFVLQQIYIYVPQSFEYRWSILSRVGVVREPD